MVRWVLPLVLLVPLTGIGFSAALAGDSDGSGKGDKARVVRVIDGDTLEVKVEGAGRRDVRLIGIDTPETVKPSAPVECGGKPAVRALKRLVHGERVRLITDRTQADRDRFGRLLRYVERGPMDVGLAQVEAGMAKVVSFDGKFSRFTNYRQAEGRAKGSGRGSWGRPCRGDFHEARGGQDRDFFNR